MNHKDYLTNKMFCPIPWTGLMYNFDGTIKNCIRSSAPIGNLRENSIEEILNNSINLATKSSMLNNEPGPRCNPCYDLERGQNSFDIISDRVFYLRELKDVPITTYDDINRFDLKKIDVRWSNLCNFSCIYCSADYSSRWESELKIKIDTPDVVQQNRFKEFIFNNAKKLKHIYLAGGEPLLMKENLELLDLLDPEVNIRINTNLSKTDTKIFEKICSFKNVHWTVSIETIEEEYEYIRYGAVWDNFLDNLKIIQKLNHKISFNMLYFALNFTSIFNCIDLLKQLGFHNNSFIIGALLHPLDLNIRQLPDNMLNLARENLQKRLNQKPGFLLENGLQNISEYMNQPFDRNTNKLFDYLKVLDKRRNLDSTKIFKELYNYGN
jgi:MoaA/NifB/PqqE/SkfB family radical SAM enzyme